MQRAWQLRSAWAWRCLQRKAKRSRGGVGLPEIETVIGGVGDEEARDGGSILAGVLNPGVIAGGPQAAANVATGGDGAGRGAARPVSLVARLARAATARASGPATAPAPCAGVTRESVARRAAATANKKARVEARTQGRRLMRELRLSRWRGNGETRQWLGDQNCRGNAAAQQ